MSLYADDTVSFTVEVEVEVCLLKTAVMPARSEVVVGDKLVSEQTCKAWEQ